MIHANPIANSRQLRQPVDIHDAVAERSRAREFERLPAVGFESCIDPLLAGIFEHSFRDRWLVGVQRVDGDLQIVVGSVIILRV